jgi:SAM-dependent methyltransferase
MTASAPTATPWYQMLPRIGTPEEFAKVRSIFDSGGYRYDQICDRLKVQSFDEYLLRLVPDATSLPVGDALDCLIRLFTDCLYLDEQTIRRTLPAGAIEAFHALNLLVREEGRSELLYAPSPVYPAGGVLTACDRGYSPAGVKCMPPVDTVYPAVLDNTLKFAKWLPMQPCEALLDIGTGTGIAAIVSAQAAKHVWATDIAARSVHFADFNRRLAGVENITLVEGDLYAPVEGLTFDRIVTHPPYVPAREKKFIFREGGADGEQIMRAIVEGLPRFLRPGGEFFCMVLGSDRERESFEQRIRKWLGEPNAEFDIAVVSDSLKTPADYIAQAVGQNLATTDDVHFWRELWTENKTEYLLHATVLIRRHSRPAEPVTARTQAGVGFDGRHLSWRLGVETLMRDPGGLELLLQSCPYPDPNCTFRVLQRVRDGRFVPEDFKFEGGSPFLTAVNCPGWMARTICSCDGRTTGRDLFDALRASGDVPDQGTPEQFARMLGALVANGVLRVEALPVPV